MNVSRSYLDDMWDKRLAELKSQNASQTKIEEELKDFSHFKMMRERQLYS